MELAGLVNLIPAEQPRDIYQAVADRVAAIVEHKAAVAVFGLEDYDWARRWHKLLGGSVPRSLAKSVVLALPYGLTTMGVMEAVTETLDDLDPQCFVFAEWERLKARAWLAKMIRTEAIGGQLASADAIMGWLKRVMSVVSRHPAEGSEKKKARGFEWTTPAGWPWVMAYGKRIRSRVKVRFGGKRSSALVHVESEAALDTQAQGDAVAANFIHALDAAALVFALNTMEREGVGGAGVIHDSICGRATEMTAIGRAAREGFVRLYDEHDPLRSFYEAAIEQVPESHRAAIPEPPAPGSLDIRAVVESAYFFA